MKTIIALLKTKTTKLAIGTICAAVGGYLTGTLELASMITGVIAGLYMIFDRHTKLKAEK